MEGISESVSQCEDVRTEKLPEMYETTQHRNLFVSQATCTKNCFRYTGITRPKLDLVFDLVKEKAQSLRYWRGSVNTPPSQHEKKEGTTQDCDYLGGTYIDPCEDKKRVWCSLSGRSFWQSKCFFGREKPWKRDKNFRHLSLNMVAKRDHESFKCFSL